MPNTIRRILGTGQGPGASPCIWTLVLDTILWSVATKYTCFQVTSPTRISINRVGDTFVDDTSIFYISPEHYDDINCTLQQIADKIEEIVQDFEQKLHSTGGNLSLPKCFWYLVHWVWDNYGNATIGTETQSPAHIYITQGSLPTTYSIKQESTFTSIRIISVRVNPQGTTDAEYQFRLSYAKNGKI